MSEQQDEQQTIEQFIAEHGLTMTSELVPENPNMDDMPKGSQHYYCTIVMESGEKSLSVYYSVGPHIVENWLFKHGPKVAWTANEGAKRREVLRGRDTFGKKEYFDATRKKYRPELADLLNCLASDAPGTEDSFEDWAANYGYDEDSRKAENTFRIDCKQARELRYLLGREAYETLVYQIERL